MDTSFKILFRSAVETDLDDVYQVFVSAIVEMNRCNIPQWDEIYPDREILKDDILKKQLYLGIINNEIASAYVVNQECDEQYRNGKWHFPNASFCVIHRLCVNHKFQNKGIGTVTMEHIESELKNKGIETIRLDAFTLNPYALRMYEKLGYIKVGCANWRKGQFYLLEKKL